MCEMTKGLKSGCDGRHVTSLRPNNGERRSNCSYMETNLIQYFTAVTFSVKLTVFLERLAPERHFLIFREFQHIQTACRTLTRGKLRNYR